MGIQDIEVAIANGEADSAEVDFTGHKYGVLRVPGTWTAADIGFKITGNDGTDYVLYDEDGTQVFMDTIVVDQWRPLPAELINVSRFKLYSKNTASAADVNQGGARAIQLILKE